MTLKYPAIFYDLETSDLSPVGQILNFCFTLVDDQFEPVDELKGTVTITRLQLPRAAAICANKIDVLAHQERADFTEAEAMRRIHEFITRIVKEHGDYKVVLAGYNTARFDLEFLRVSLIRNGLHPYFRVIYRDLLFVSRKLAVTESSFPVMENSSEPGRRSLKLEALCSAAGILDGEQLHESSADVRLTISLARYYAEHFKIDVRRYVPYEPSALERAKQGLLVERLVPNYDLKCDSRFEAIPYVLLDANHRYALWINLRRFAELKGSDTPIERAIEFFKFDGCDFFSDLHAPSDQSSQTALEAIGAFRHLSLKNYFKESDCDIEAQSGRLDQTAIEGLRRRIWFKDPGVSLSDDARRLAARFKLANAPEGSSGLDVMLREYALYRYGGRMKISRHCDASFEEGVFLDGFHPAFTDLVQEIKDQMNRNEGHERVLMQRLLDFYMKSDIYRVAGADLERINRRVAAQH